MLKRKDKITGFSVAGNSTFPDTGEAPYGRMFFERLDWGVFWVVFLGIALFYAYTQAPTVTLEDSGELVVAADYLGVPHPPGYPLWTIAAWLFTRIFRFVTYMGQPNPAWGVNFCSGFFGALTCGLVAMLVSRLGVMFGVGGPVDQSGRRRLRWLAAVGGVAAGYLLGFNVLFWSQSVIAEVYTVNAFLHMLILLLSAMWIYRGRDNRILYWLSFIFGLSITNCQPIVFLGPSLLIVFYFTDRPLFRDCMALGLALIGAYMLRAASLPLPGVQLATPSGAKMLVAVLMLASPLAIWIYTRRLLTEWRRIVIMALCLGLGLSLFVYLPIASDFNPPMNWGYPRTWEGFKHAVGRGQYQALNPALNIADSVRQVAVYLRELEIQYTILPMLAGLLPVFLLPRLRRRDRVWLAVLATAFLMLGLGMMLLLNPAPDIQALFIARVQLVPAAAVYAVLIGYGLVVALQFCQQYLERLPRLPGRLLLGLLSAFVLVAPAGLVWKNYNDTELSLAYGGADLRGHDFGWQFGNYQLRGAPAILKELDPDEPPLPNPEYPPPMEPDAIFFGGTDPGRFVPTYMIYSARVRPDVFLITQNALADNTYMNVMRDLYGDQIWMPTPQDVNEAFQTYVQDVQSGRLPRSAAIAIDPGGKVSVQGVQGVMEINGIISKMMFEMNKHRHAFYVEESYVIAWMYPYLEPHGLILKINPEPLPELTPEMVRNDMEFWTWYGNRLMNDRKFLRNATARKSFSKLRCAIAGLYVYRRMFAEAEAAFLQAVELAPLSPEANFRLADLYVQLGRYADALQVMERNAELDPRNDKIVDFIKQVRDLEGMQRRVEELQQNMSQGQATLEQVFELAALFLRTGREQPFMDLARQMLQDESLPPPALLRLAEMAAQAPSPPRLEMVIQAFEKYLQQEPSNARARHELACARLARGQVAEALRELRRAVDLGGEPMRTSLRQDQRLAPLRTNQAFQRLVEPVARSGFRPPPGFVFP